MFLVFFGCLCVDNVDCFGGICVFVMFDYFEDIEVLFEIGVL